MIPKQIVDIANRARDITETFATIHPFVGDVKTLQGYCAIASKITSLLFRKHLIEVKIIQGCCDEPLYYKDHRDINHCWNEYKNLIIDVTATQFDFNDRVLIVQKRNVAEKYITLRRTETFMDWRGHQSPLFFSKEIEQLLLGEK